MDPRGWPGQIAAACRELSKRARPTFLSAKEWAAGRIEAAQQRWRDAAAWLARHGLDRDSRVAIVMSVIATFAATTEFFASSAESNGSGCQRKLEEARNFELVHRQSYLAQRSENIRWADEYTLHVAQGNSFLERAEAARVAGSHSARSAVSADVLDADAQVEFAVARLIAPVKEFFDPSLLTTTTIDSALTERAQRDLRDLGVRNHCEPGSFSNASRADYLAPLISEIDATNQRTERDFVVVALFVFALACFSVTEMASGLLLVLCDVLGLAAFIAATILAVLWDHQLGRVFSIAAILVVPAGLIVWEVVSRRLPRPVAAAAGGEGSPNAEATELQPEIATDPTARMRYRNPQELKRNPIGKWIVPAVAIVALGIAWHEYGHAHDKIRSEASATNAAMAQIHMLREETYREVTAYDDVRKMMLLREARLRAAVARDLVASASVPGDEQVLWEREAMRWSSSAGLRHGGPATADDGPVLDPFFPSTYVVGKTVEGSATDLAKWDAIDEVSDAWERRGLLLLGVVALFTIASYLLTQALGMGPSPGGHFLAVSGVGVLAAGGILAITSWNATIPLTGDVVEIPAPCVATPAPDKHQVEAATYAAQRDVAVATCFARAETTARAPGGATYRTLLAYVAAAQLRPGFVFANYRAAPLLGILASPQRNTAHVSVADRGTLSIARYLDRTIAANLADHALALPITLEESQALHDYLYALDYGDRDVLRTSIASLGQAVTVQDELARQEAAETNKPVEPHPETAPLRYRYAVQLLADGRDASARAAYADARAHIGPDPDLSVGAMAVSDLNVLIGRCGGLTWMSAARCSQIRSIAGEQQAAIVAATWQTPARRPHHSGKPAEMSVDVVPGGVNWRLTQPAHAPLDPQSLVMLAYRLDPDRRTWYVLPEISSRVTRSELRSGRAGELAGYRSLLLHSHYWDCMQLSGNYRFEMYAGGERVAQAEVVLAESHQTMRGVPMRDPGVAMCYPDDWLRQPIGDGRLAAGYTAPNNRRGAYAFAFIARHGVARAEYSEQQRRAVARSVQLLVNGLNLPIPVDIFGHQQQRCESYIADWETPHVEYVAPDYTILAKAWSSTDGLMHVGLVWQKAGTPDQLSCRILASMISVDADTVKKLAVRPKLPRPAGVTSAPFQDTAR
jgi:hypothetical protein